MSRCASFTLMKRPNKFMAKLNISRPPKKPSPPPVLTEVVDDGMADIPTLTEVHTDTATHLTDAQCQQLLAQIAPQIDILLQQAVHDIKSRLPELIRTVIDKKSW